MKEAWQSSPGSKLLARGMRKESQSVCGGQLARTHSGIRPRQPMKWHWKSLGSGSRQQNPKKPVFWFPIEEWWTQGWGETFTDSARLMMVQLGIIFNFTVVWKRHACSGDLRSTVPEVQLLVSIFKLLFFNLEQVYGGGVTPSISEEDL